MEIYYIIAFFIIGISLGSFYNVVGYRLAREKSIIKPPSHCPMCNHRLKSRELIPVVSYIMQKGKCKNCKEKISPFYPFFEALTGILFVVSYLIFGTSLEFLISLIFVSTLIVVIISDYQTMIIPDEVLIVGGILLLITYLIKDPVNVWIPIVSGIACFLIMWLIKIMGDIMFKKESLGGGDIKLMFIIGMALGIPMGLFSIFVGSFIALPFALFILFTKKENLIPYGPFLSMGALILFFTQIKWEDIYNLLISIS